MVLRLVLLAALSFAAAAQQPVILYRGILNAASLAPPGLPNAPLAKGSVFTIFGANIGPATPATVSEFPLAPVFQNVAITVSQGSFSSAAIPIFVSASQINAILPSGTPTGTVGIRVTFNGRASNTVAVEVAENSPGIFAVSSGGFGPGVVQNFVTSANQPINSLDTSATRGQAITIWATGLGRVPYPDNIAPTAGNLDVPVSVTVGESAASVLYAGRSPCCAGVDQIVIQIPSDAPYGCYVPLRIKSGRAVSNTVTLAIAETAGARCSDTFNPFQSFLRSTRRQGMIFLDRAQHYVDSFLTTTEQNTTDNVRAYFHTRAESPFVFDPQVSLPPPGTCQVHQTTGNIFRGAPLRGSVPGSAALDAGSIRITTPPGTFDLTRITTPQTGFASVAGSLRAADGVGLLKLDFASATNIAINGPLGSTTLQPNNANLFAWTNRINIDRIRRDVINRIAFTPNDFGANYVLALNSYSSVLNASVSVVCVNPLGRDTFLLTPDLLSALPPSYGKADGSFSMLAIGAYPLARAVPFSLPGLDGGLALFSQWLTRSVYIQ